MKRALGEGHEHHWRRSGASTRRERCERAPLSSESAVAHERFTTMATIGVSPRMPSCGACNGRRLAPVSARPHARHHRVKTRPARTARLANVTPRVGDDGDVGESSHSAQCNAQVKDEYSAGRRRSAHTGHRTSEMPSNHRDRRSRACKRSRAVVDTHHRIDGGAICSGHQSSRPVRAPASPRALLASPERKMNTSPHRSDRRAASTIALAFSYGISTTTHHTASPLRPQESAAP